MPYDPSEQNAITAIFAGMLDACTKDGGKKRESGGKVDWRIDGTHEAGIFSHLNKWKHGEQLDPDSGAHPLVHLAWRALAIAWQETNATPTLAKGLTEEELIKLLSARDCPCCEVGEHTDPAFD